MDALGQPCDEALFGHAGIVGAKLGAHNAAGVDEVRIRELGRVEIPKQQQPHGMANENVGNDGAVFLRNYGRKSHIDQRPTIPADLWVEL